MSRISWNDYGSRHYEAGLDRGVLYIDNRPGVPWNGLIAVNESPSGGNISSYYLDGIKYLDHPGQEEYQAEIEAYTYPEEFSECEGVKHAAYGLYVTNQKKKPFGLTYRTKIGNDEKQLDHGYKIHLIYNAIVEPSDRDYETLDDDVEPLTFTWSIFTKPPEFNGYWPTSHFVIDSRKIPSHLRRQLEDILYGSETTFPRLPSVQELLFLFEAYDTSIFDAGTLVEEYFVTFDCGVIPEPQTSTIEGGGP